MKSFVPLIFSEMELGLSLGDTRKSVDGILKENNNQQKPTKKKSELGFCMALGLNSSAVENDDQRSEGDGSDDDINEGENENHLQLNLLPLASNNESLENGSSGNMGLAAAIGLDVNSLPAAEAAEEVSSANSDGSRFQMGFAIYRRNSRDGNSMRSNKRDHTDFRRNDAVEAERACSDDDDEDDDNNGLNTRKKLRLSKEQSAFLEESFKEHHTLYPKQKLELAKQLNLRPRQVEVWFQNRRARTKLKQTEVDCEYLKRCRETLTEENKRLQKELQELRALKTSNPFYMQLPATTLTMCPSCERVAAAPPPSSAATATATAAAAPKTIAFPLTRPILYPFSKTSNKSAAS